MKMEGTTRGRGQAGAKTRLNAGAVAIFPDDVESASFPDDLLAGAGDDPDQFNLFFRGHFELLERSAEIGEGGIEFLVADLHPGMDGDHGPPLVLLRTAGGGLDVLRKPLLQLCDVFACRLPLGGMALSREIHPRVCRGTVHEVADDRRDCRFPAKADIQAGGIRRRH